jgi:uroporphyrinogen-III decarboxylase
MVFGEIDNQWQELTREQKREKRQARFLNPVDVNFIDDDARKLYQIRAQRLLDVYNVREPDRVPLTFHLGSLPLLYSGVDYATGMRDFAKAIQAYNRFNQQFASELVTFSSVSAIFPGQAFELLDYKMYAWPGHGLPQNSGNYQFVEGEYMKVDEYTDLIEDPTDFWIRCYMPRIFGALKNLGSLPPVTDNMEIPAAQVMILADPQVQKMLQTLIDAGKCLQERIAHLKSFSSEGSASGFPPMINYLCIAPFDLIGDALRGTQGIMMDMYRCPDKLMEAMEVIANLQIKRTIRRARSTRGLVVTFPLHKGADGWMSQTQFEKFYWPSLKKSIDAFIDEGLIVSLFAEGSYNTRLESVNEFPKGAVHWWFDKTDMAKAKKTLGEKCSIAGNVPASMLMTGTPGEVKEYCRNLIKTCGEGGGYILSEGAGEVEAKLENLQAMAEAAREYGVYKK